MPKAPHKFPKRIVARTLPAPAGPLGPQDLPTLPKAKRPASPKAPRVVAVPNTVPTPKMPRKRP